MTAITTRSTGTTGVNGVTRKDSPLSNAEIDNNFINLNDNKLELTDLVSTNTANKGVKRDSSGNFVAGTITAALSGNATTATTLQTARNINGQSFNGSANIFTPCTYDSAFKNFSNPAGGIYTTSSSSVTGAIAITLPLGMNNGMMTMTVKIYEYTTNEMFEVHIGGYASSSGTTWANNPSAYIVGNANVDRRFSVRFGYTAGGKGIIYIGELASTWSYPQVFVTEFAVGYNGASESWASGWTVGFVSSAFENVTATVSDSQVGWTAQALQTANNYQVNSIGIGTAANGTAGRLDAADVRTTALTSGTISATTITETSSIVYKENIHQISGALDLVSKLTGVVYDRIDGSRTNEAGMIAEDVEKIIPNLVTLDVNGKAEGITYSKTVAYLVEAIKELKSELDILKGSK